MRRPGAATTPAIEVETATGAVRAAAEAPDGPEEAIRTANIELRARVEALSRANGDLRARFANVPVAMLFLDRDLRIVSFTPPATSLFGLHDHDLGRPLGDLPTKLEAATLGTDAQAVIREGTPLEREVRTADENTETFLMRIIACRDEQERIRGAVLTFIDITKGKQAEARLAGTASELNHRLRNALAGAQAMVRQSAASATSLAAFSEAIQGRLEAMAVANGLLAEASWQGARLDRLADAVVVPLVATGPDRLIVSGPDVDLRPEVTVPMGIILHELATNAVRHGAWTVPEGSVALRWACPLGEGGILRLSWTERGGPPAYEPEREGFGLDFIRQSTAYQLRGKCRTAFGAEGFRCSLTLPPSSFRRAPPGGRKD